MKSAKAVVTQILIAINTKTTHGTMGNDRGNIKNKKTSL